MFSEQKWNILRCLSQGKSSPLQLAGKLNTTMANISQQLRLLEATNLVKKEKIRNKRIKKVEFRLILGNKTNLRKESKNNSLFGRKEENHSKDVVN